MVASSLRLKLVNANKPVYVANDKVKGFYIILAGSCSEHKFGRKTVLTSDDENLDSLDEAGPADQTGLNDGAESPRLVAAVGNEPSGGNEPLAANHRNSS